MKKTNILLTSILALLFLGCSGKTPVTPTHRVDIPAPRTVQTPRTIQTPQRVETHAPSLGRPLSMPSRVEREPLPVYVPPPKQSVEFRAGESQVRKQFKLPHALEESSGLINVDNRLWTINDSGGRAALYQIDERTGRVVKTFVVTNAKNRDWEDLAYDENYVYIGDFGNNRGNSKALKVYKIPRASLRNQTHARAEVISFRYSDQKDFRSRPYKSNYDCEAMVAYHGKLYLFSKNWENQKTRLYELSTTAGRHVAKYMSTFNTQGMVTGASINRELDILLLSTYSPLLSVKMWVFKNFNGANFFSGNVKSLNLKTALSGQIEGVTFTDNYRAYLSSEAFSKYFISFDASLFSLDFSGEFE